MPVTPPGPSYALEDLVLTKCLRTGTISPLTDAGVDESWWCTKETRQAWLDIVAHLRAHGKVPDEATMVGVFTSSIWKPTTHTTDEPWDYYVNEIIDRRKYLIYQDMISDIQTAIRDDPPDSVALMDRVTAGFHRELAKLSSSKFVVQTYAPAVLTQRLSRYTSGETPAHAPTGFGHLDSKLLGLRPGQLWTLYALPKSYKTASVTWMAQHWAKQGRRVLFFSFEMGEEEINHRMDAFVGGLDLTAIQANRLTDVQRDQLDSAWTQELHESLYLYSGRGINTVDEVMSYTLDIDPEIIIIDGAYFLQDPAVREGRGSPQNLTSVTRHLKQVARNKDVGILITTQALVQKVKGARAGWDSIGYSSSFAQDSDIVIGLTRVPTPNTVLMELALSRVSDTSEANVEWDLSTGSWAYYNGSTTGATSKPSKPSRRRRTFS